MPAGEALQQAKLQYLLQADGRTKAPAYWAGLVLMGDAGAVTLLPKSNAGNWFWIMGILAVAGSVVLFVMIRKNKLQRSINL